MSTHGLTTPRRGSLVPAAATFTQALWHIRHVWRLFLLITVGMIAAVVLVCSLPLFSQVNSTAGIRSAINSGLFGKYSFAQADSQVVSAPAIKQATQRLTQGYQQIAGDAFHAAPDSTISLHNLAIFQHNRVIPQHFFLLHGYDFGHIGPHIKLVQGRLPQANSNGLEIALTQGNAFSLNVQVGSTLTIFTSRSGAAQPMPVQLTVVGIFSVNAPFEDYWHGDSFDVSINSQTGVTTNMALVSNADLLSTFDRLARAHPDQSINFSAEYHWYYPFDEKAVTSTNTDQVQRQFQQLSSDLPTRITNEPFITDVSLANNGLKELLQDGLDQNSTSQVPVIMLTILMLGLILLFISVMTEILVLRQAESIVLTSHRGASFGQIFGTFVTQSLIIGLIALIVSPALIMLTVRVLFRFLFPLSDQSALDALSTNVLAVALDLRWYLLATMLIAVAAMSVSVWRTLRSSTLGSGTKTTAATQRPLWQRFYVDVVLGLLGLLVYGFYHYLLWTGSIDPQLQVLLAGPSMLVAATLLTLAGVLLYLRCFPLLLRLGTILAARRRGIVPLLSLVVMARAPRQAMRTALLLVFTITFALFSLVFTATQEQREYDLVDYRAGADFSGPMQQESTLAPDRLVAAYRQVSGVLSASVGHLSYENFPKANYGIQVMAVNTESFATSVTWSQEGPGQDAKSIQGLLARLTAQRGVFVSAGQAPKVPLPAIVDTATKNLLHLSVGKTFTMSGANKDGARIDLVMVDVGEVNHLPGTNDLAPLKLGSVSGGSANILVDYQSYVNDYNKTINNPDADLKLNYAWLHTKQDARSLANVRSALKHGPLALDPVNDAREMLAALQHDPLYLNLMCALTLGIALSLVLALLGNVTSSWLYVRNRLRSLAVLRALGTTPSQLATLLGWEQGIVYATAIVLGVLFGAFFTAVTLSSLVFSQLSLTGTQINPYATDIFVLQSIPALRVVVPPSLLIALGVLVVLCILALLITTYTVSRPSLAQTLRLSEDYVEDAPLSVARTRDQRAASERDRAAARARRAGQAPGLFGSGSVARAFSPLRSSGGYMALTCLGIVVSVLLVCLVPLFSRVASSAGMRDVLARPENRYASVTASFPRFFSPGGLPQLIGQNTRELNDAFLKQGKNYFSGQPEFALDGVSINTADAAFSSAPQSSVALAFYGLTEQNMAGHVQVVQGHLPSKTAMPLQVALTPEAATFLRVKVNDVLPPMAGSPFPVQVVGLFRPATTSDPLLPSTFLTISDASKHQGGVQALVANDGFISVATAFARSQPPDSYVMNGGLSWFYRINGEQLTSDQLDDLRTTLETISDGMGTVFRDSRVAQSSLPIFALEQYEESMQVAGVPIVTIAVLVVGLILLFLSFMAELLVEREAEAIAILRSRGATHRQIFASFLKRALLLNGLGLVLGLLLVIPAVALLTWTLLLPVDQRALNIVTAQPVQSVLDLAWYALGTIAITLGAIALALYRATSADYLALRRETARSSRRPLWQRFYLDIVGAIVALAAYGFSLYLTNTGILDTQVNVQVKSPLVLTATICLVLACSLLLLRLFPLLLRLGTILATRNRNVAPMLALAQMARAPQQSVRVALLLLFTTAFVVFVSIFTSSQNAHLADVANYWTGADFSGPMPASATTDQQAAYQRLRGVTTATTGYVSSMVNSQQDVELKLIAADPAAFMRVVIWPEMGTAEQKSALNQVLSSRQAQLQATMPHADTAPGATGPDDAVPAIVDETTWDTLQLAPGKRFILRGPVGGITFLAMGKVAHIPTINDRSQTFGNGGAVTSGLLVDYQSYAAVYNYHLARQERNPGGFAGRGQQPTPIRANYVWMSTQSDAQTLAGVRKALSSGPLQLAALYDRRATMQTLRTDPLSLNLVGMLILGAAVPLLLTWVGCLIASWATTRQRQTLFGVLRALGCPPRQLTRVLVWEQAIVYGSAVVLGVLFGLLTALMALPSLVLTSAVPGIYVPSSGGDFMPTFDLNNTLDLFSLQNTPPAHTVISPSLGVVIGLLVLLGVLAVALMSRGIARMTLSQVLRVNRD